MGYYHNYGVIYTGNFSSIPMGNEGSYNYFFNILQKNKSKNTNVTTVTCANDPAIHSYLEDSLNNYISGSELKLRLLNNDGLLPLSKFYSENDDEWKIEFYVTLIDGVTITNQLLFSGYLVQEDCQEIAVDYTHEIELSFTDNIGLLKDISLDIALKQTPIYNTQPQFDFSVYIKTIDVPLVNGYFEIDWVPTNIPEVGDSMIIENCAFGNGVYTITNVIVNGTKLNVFVEEDITTINLTQGSVRFIKTYKQYDIITLRDLYWIIIYNTGIPLNIFFKNNLEEVKNVQSFNRKRILEYIKIGLNTFYENDNFDSLDEVLEKLNTAFKISFYQTLGVWCIIRTLDLDFSFLGFKYDYKFNHVADNAPIYDYLEYIKDIGIGYDIENGLLTSIERPLKLIEEKYDYKVPQLVYNGNMDIVGKFFDNWTDGSGLDIKKYESYEALGWIGNKVSQNPLIFSPVHIEIEYDYYDTEKDRYLVLEKGDIQAFVSNSVPIKLSKGDIIRVSYEIKPRTPFGGDTVMTNMFLITKDPDAPFSQPNGDNWIGFGFQPYTQTTSGWSYRLGHPVGFTADDDTWQTIQSPNSKPVPYDCYAYFSFPHFLNRDLLIRNLQVEITRLVNKAKSIKGHSHTTTIPNVIKNVDEHDIHIDDSPSWVLKGCLYTNIVNGIINEKTQTWCLDNPTAVTKALGEIICRQDHIQFGKRRLKLEGNIFPIIYEGNTPGKNIILSKYIKLMYMPPDPEYGVPMLFGKMDLNYKSNQANFTAFELAEGMINIYTEPNNTTYTFKYITE